MSTKARFSVALVALLAATALAQPVPTSFTLLVLEERDAFGRASTITLTDRGAATYQDASGRIFSGDETSSALVAQSALALGAAAPGPVVVGLPPPPLPTVAIGTARSATLRVTAPNGAVSVFAARPSATGVLLFGAPLDSVARALRGARDDLVLNQAALVPVTRVISASDGNTTITITEPVTGPLARPGTHSKTHSKTVILGPGGVPIGSVETESETKTETRGILGVLIHR